VVSKGGQEANHSKSIEYGLRDVLVQQGSDVADVYGVRGTPSAVLLREDGTLAGAPAEGAEEISALVALVISRNRLAAMTRDMLEGEIIAAPGH
jgi:hypothetical protein